jgi:hypothetical protein
VTASSVGLGPHPLDAQETPWRQVRSAAAENLRALGATHVATFQRYVTDGHLSAFVTREPPGPGGVSEWHLSISHRTNEHPPKAGRYPTWDEIAHARYELLPADLTFAMFLPPREQYVAVHDTTFHLYAVHPGQVSAVTKGRRRRG